eukprot:GHVQ01037416.1.p1 GENE.GHVQ01037416.1~~GHVQ01037416.1.p1  ORF type:complete len:604 (+),score=63.25 GHVQ01037416.1:167-1978(+)
MPPCDHSRTTEEERERSSSTRYPDTQVLGLDPFFPGHLDTGLVIAVVQHIRQLQHVLLLSSYWSRCRLYLWQQFLAAQPVRSSSSACADTICQSIYSLACFGMGSPSQYHCGLNSSVLSDGGFRYLDMRSRRRGRKNKNRIEENNLKACMTAHADVTDAFCDGAKQVLVNNNAIACTPAALTCRWQIALAMCIRDELCLSNRRLCSSHDLLLSCRGCTATSSVIPTFDGTYMEQPEWGSRRSDSHWMVKSKFACDGDSLPACDTMSFCSDPVMDINDHCILNRLGFTTTIPAIQNEMTSHKSSGHVTSEQRCAGANHKLPVSEIMDFICDPVLDSQRLKTHNCGIGSRLVAFMPHCDLELYGELLQYFLCGRHKTENDRDSGGMIATLGMCPQDRHGQQQSPEPRSDVCPSTGLWLSDMCIVGNSFSGYGMNISVFGLLQLPAGAPLTSKASNDDTACCDMEDEQRNRDADRSCVALKQLVLYVSPYITETSIHTAGSLSSEQSEAESMRCSSGSDVTDRDGMRCSDGAFSNLAIIVFNASDIPNNPTDFWVETSKRLREYHATVSTDSRQTLRRRRRTQRTSSSQSTKGRYDGAVWSVADLI